MNLQNLPNNKPKVGSSSTESIMINTKDLENNSTESSTVGLGVGFQKVRRITGYLVGDWRKRFNDAKRAEVDDRVSHVVVS